MNLLPFSRGNDPTGRIIGKQVTKRYFVAEITELETALEHKFKTHALLVRALTHSSLAYEQATRNETPTPDSADNEQMEFLGDAVVGLLVAEYLYTRHP